MRQTLLNFRSPCERSGEYRITTVTKGGHNLQYEQKLQFNQTGRRSNFSQEKRFKDAALYCKHTGQSMFLGSGSYKPEENFYTQHKKPCSAVMKKNGNLDEEESKKQAYIMIGHQVKYEPAWASSNNKQFIDNTMAGNCIKSTTQAFSKQMVKQASQNLHRTRTGQLQPSSKSQHEKVSKLRKTFIVNATEGLIHQQIENCNKDNIGESMKRLDKILKKTNANLDMSKTQSFNSQNKSDEGDFVNGQTQMEVLTKMKDINSSAGFGDIDVDYPGALSKSKPKKKVNPNILFSNSVKNRNVRTEALQSNKRYKREDENIDHIEISTQLNNTSNSILNGNRNNKGLSVGPGSLNRTQQVRTTNQSSSGGNKALRQSYLTEDQSNLLNKTSSAGLFEENANIQNPPHISSNMYDELSPRSRNLRDMMSSQQKALRKTGSALESGIHHPRIRAETSELIHNDTSSFASSMPKSAVNFQLMKKGLYLNKNAKKKELMMFAQKQKSFMKAYNFSLRDYSDQDDTMKHTQASPGHNANINQSGYNSEIEKHQETGKKQTLDMQRMRYSSDCETNDRLNMVASENVLFRPMSGCALMNKNFRTSSKLALKQIRENRRCSSSYRPTKVIINQINLKNRKKSQNKNKMVVNQSLDFNSSLGTAAEQYMNVIHDSQDVIMRKEHLMLQKKKIMNMNFGPPKQSNSSLLDNFLQQNSKK